MPDEPKVAEPKAPSTWERYKPWLIRVGVTLLIAAVTTVFNRYGIPLPPIEPPPAPLVDLSPFDYENCPFHGAGDHEHVGERQAARWPIERLTYSVDYASARGLNPPLSDEAVRGGVRLGFSWWSEHLHLEFVEVPHGTAGTHIPIRFEPMDGPGGTLAEAYLADGTTRPKPMRLDSRERWTAGLPAPNTVSIPTVICHEGGHSLGSGHDAGNAPAIMRPTYSSSIPREQPRDIDRMVNELGYRRREKVPPPQSDIFEFKVTARKEDVFKALDAAGLKVVPK